MWFDYTFWNTPQVFHKSVKETWWLSAVPVRVYQTESLTSTLLQFGHTLIFSVDFCFERKAREEGNVCLLSKASHFCRCSFLMWMPRFFNRFPLGHLSPLNGARWTLTFWLKKGFKPFFLSQTDVRRVEAEVSVAPVTTLSDWTGGEKCNWGGMRRSPVRVKQQEIICTSCLPPYTHTCTHALSRALNMFKKQTLNAKFNGAVLTLEILTHKNVLISGIKKYTSLSPRLLP